MTKGLKVISYIGSFLVGAALLQLYHAQRTTVVPTSAALCFLQESPRNPAFAQFDGKLLTRETLPRELYATYLQVESDTRARFSEIAKKMALALDSKPATDAAKDASPTNRKPDAIKKTITEEDARAYFNQNKNAFPNVTFDKVSKLIVDLLQKREDQLHERGKISQLESDNRFHLLYPMPCGGKVNPPYGNSMPGRGNTTADLRLLYLFSFNCFQCRQATTELMDFINQNVSTMRIWFLPIAGVKGSRDHSFSAAMQCSFDLEPSKIIMFHRSLMNIPIMNDEKETLKTVMSEAKSLGIDPDKLSKCMESPDTQKQLTQYKEFADGFGFSGDSPRYFLNERGMDPNVGSDIVAQLKFVISERERLKKQL